MKSWPLRPWFLGPAAAHCRASSARLCHLPALAFASAHAHPPSIAPSASSLRLPLVHDCVSPWFTTASPLGSRHKTPSCVTGIGTAFSHSLNKCFQTMLSVKGEVFLSTCLAFFYMVLCLPSHLAFLSSLYILISKTCIASFWG